MNVIRENHQSKGRKKKLPLWFYRVCSWAFDLEFARRYPQHAY